MGEPQLAHKKVVELEAQVMRDVKVRPLLVGQADVEPHGPAARFGRAPVGGLHDARATARADDVAVQVQVRRKPLGPFGNEPRELAGFLVVAAERPVGRDPVEPKKTMVSWMNSRRNASSGERYLARMRNERAPSLSMKCAFLWASGLSSGASSDTLASEVDEAAFHLNAQQLYLHTVADIEPLEPVDQFAFHRRAGDAHPGALV